MTEIDALLDDLEPEGRGLSGNAAGGHERIDNLDADVRAGADSGAALARLEVWERRLSAERRALHASIDALYEARDRTGAPSRRPEALPGARGHGPTLVDPDARSHAGRSRQNGPAASNGPNGRTPSPRRVGLPPPAR